MLFNSLGFGKHISSTDLISVNLSKLFEKDMRKILCLRERYAHFMKNGTLEPLPGSTQN